jgi:flagellar motor switch/type III secretory pathway protein FliN
MEPSRTETPVDQPPGAEAAWNHVKGLLCRLSVEIPIQHFNVRQLLDLAPGAILDTHYEEGSHVPVIVNGQLIARGEFDVVEEALAIRLTELVS